MNCKAVLASMAIVFAISNEGQPADSSTGPWNIRTEAIAVELSQPAALGLISELRARQNSEAIGKLWDGIVRGDFRLIDQVMVWSYVTGPMAWAHPPYVTMAMPMEFRDIAESIEELRYPTNFEPPQVPQTFGGETAARSRLAVSRFIPNSFETRNLGLSLQVNCRVFSDGLITLDLDVSHVALKSFNKSISPSVATRYGVWDQPEFRTSRVTTCIDVTSGEWELVNSYARGRENPRMMLFLIRATAIPIQP